MSKRTLANNAKVVAIAEHMVVARAMLLYRNSNPVMCSNPKSASLVASQLALLDGLLDACKMLSDARNLP